MGVIKKIVGSRWMLFLLGVAVGLWVIPSIQIPKDTLSTIWQFIWSQKWGVLIGVGAILLINKLKGGFAGYRIVRDEGSSRRR